MHALSENPEAVSLLESCNTNRSVYKQNVNTYLFTTARQQLFNGSVSNMVNENTMKTRARRLSTCSAALAS